MRKQEKWHLQEIQTQQLFQSLQSFSFIGLVNMTELPHQLCGVSAK